MSDSINGVAPKAAAFFDLDRTIIGGSSVFTFGWVAYRNGMIPTRQLLGDAASAISFKLFGASDEKSERVKDQVLAGIKGTALSDLRELGDEILDRLLDSVRRESRGLIDLHSAAGRDTYIVSASPIEIIRDFGVAMEMTGTIGTVSEIVDGVYTGRLAEPFCYGEGKAMAIERIAAERGYNLNQCYGYTDSISDLPMLECVGHPVAVNPDHALESIARMRGWPIIEFNRTTKRVVKNTTAAVGAAGVATATYFLGRRHGRASERFGSLR
ncbi:MAG: HAD-IB family hydrolase [bacterium]|nr:HAD-IB family hydrolase [bacterium]